MLCCANDQENPKAVSANNQENLEASEAGANDQESPKAFEVFEA